jgi:hypothetical protein
LPPQQSALKRDLLLSDLETVHTGDAAALWAHSVMAAKNSLTAADAARVEAAFHTKVSTLQKDDEDAAAPPSAQSRMDGDAARRDVPARHSVAADANAPVDGIDKSALALPEPRRVRDKEHLQFVASQPCLICGRKPSDPHHLRFAQARALGRKASDEFTVPLCRGHHRELHRYGDEASWWSKAGIDPIGAAWTLWTEMHPLRSVAETRNADKSTAAHTETSRSPSIPPRPNATRNRKTNPIILNERTRGI